MKHLDDIDVLLKHLRLPKISRNSIKDQNIDIGLILVRLNDAIHVAGPQLNRQLVRDEFPPFGELDKLPAEFGPGIETTKNITTRVMVKSRDLPENRSLRPFS